MLPPEVVRATVAPLLGHLDPDYLRIMEETQGLLRQVFQTANETTLVLPATGGAGMEAALDNFLEPGDTAIVCVAGFFGGRLAELAHRTGATVVRVEAPWGKIVDPAAVEKALKAQAKVKLVALVHGETSTGVAQPLADIVRLAHEHDALLVVDTVASLGGVDVPVDALGIDVCYSGSQKCLSAPPGLAPITANDRAMHIARTRKTPVHSWYLDLTLHEKYWGAEHLYHHTGPALMMYAMREALRLTLEEGLPERFARHKMVSDALVAGLEDLGFRLFSDPAHRLPTLTAVLLPEGLDDSTARRRLLYEFGIEVGGGLGPYRGKMWRIGTMGYSARMNNVMLLLEAISRILRGA